MVGATEAAAAGNTEGTLASTESTRKQVRQSGLGFLPLLFRPFVELREGAPPPPPLCGAVV
ncbi:uncharacterized protein V6R79_022919 [Siganus canaliculatus]